MKEFVVGFMLGAMIFTVIVYFIMYDKYIYNLRWDKRNLEDKISWKETQEESYKEKIKLFENRIEILRKEKEVLQEQIIDEIRGRNKNEGKMDVESEYRKNPRYEI